MNRVRFSFLCVLCVLGGAAHELRPGVVAEREILVRNRLDVERPNELIVVTLRELGIAPEGEKAIRDVEVSAFSPKDAKAHATDGDMLPCQLDRFSEVPGFGSEVAFTMDLGPFEARLVVLRFLDAERELTKPPFTVLSEAGSLWVSTPEFVVRLKKGATGLWVTGAIVRKQPKSEEEQLDEAEEERPPAEGTPESATGDVKAETPFGAGLSFGMEGVPPVSPDVTLKSWSGPARAVVALFDQGPLPIGRGTVKCRITQSFSFPRAGKAIFLDVRILPEEEIPAGQLDFAGVRVDSVGSHWEVYPGQDGKPPQVAPVRIALQNKRLIVLEPYQRSTFNHTWATLVCEKVWLGLVVDRVGSDLPGNADWATGRVLLPCTLGFRDDGCYVNAVQPVAHIAKLPAGTPRKIRAALYFGEGKKPGDVEGLARRFNSPLVVPHIDSPREKRPSLDTPRLKQLLQERDVVVVTPDRESEERARLWAELADKLGGCRRRSAGFIQYYNVASATGDPALLVVLVGEPGSNELLDQFNARHRAFDPYPLAEDRSTVELFEPPASAPSANPPAPGWTVLLVSGNNEAALERAVRQVMALSTGARQLPPISISEDSFAGSMPHPWAGTRDSQKPIAALAYRNGYANHLFLLRANQAVKDLRIEVPEGVQLRSVRWQFGSGERTTPTHDAARPGVPTELDKDELMTVWLRRRIPKDAAPGQGESAATIEFAGGRRTVRLETEILAPVLPDKPAMGFFPMGDGKPGLKLHFGWKDDTAYYEHIPGILRTMGEFGVSAYQLDLSVLKASLDPDGKVVIDTGEFRKELEAVRSSGAIDTPMAGAPLGLQSILPKIKARHGVEDDFEAWEYIIPALRKALRELDLEDKLPCFYADEPADYEPWLPISRVLKRAGFRMTVAINGYGVINRRLAVGTMGFWVPLYNFYLNRWGKPVPDDDAEMFSKNFRDACHARGEQIWPYVCGPWPYASSSRPRSQAWFLMLDDYMKGADGQTYYGGWFWSHGLDPAYRGRVKADLFGYDYTFYTLWYPDEGRDTVLPSLRAGAFQMGLEDATATEALRTLAKAKGASAKAEATIQESYEQIHLDSPLATFEAHRRSLAKLYAELAR